MMFASNTVADARNADIYVDLDTKGCNAYDMSKLEKLFFRGYDSTIKVLEENGFVRQLPKEEITFERRKTFIGY